MHKSKILKYIYFFFLLKSAISGSPSKSYDEDRRKYFLNSFLNRYKTKTNSTENEDGQNSILTTNSNSNPQSPSTLSVNTKTPVKYSVSLDTYRRTNSQKLAREKAVEDLEDILPAENITANLLNNSLNISSSDNSKTGNTTPTSSASTPNQTRKNKNNGNVNKDKFNHI